MSLCVSICTFICRYLWRPTEGIRHPGARNTGVSNLAWVLEKQTWESSSFLAFPNSFMCGKIIHFSIQQLADYLQCSTGVFNWFFWCFWSYHGYLATLFLPTLQICRLTSNGTCDGRMCGQNSTGWARGMAQLFKARLTTKFQLWFNYSLSHLSVGTKGQLTGLYLELWLMLRSEDWYLGSFRNVVFRKDGRVMYILSWFFYLTSNSV